MCTKNTKTQSTWTWEKNPLCNAPLLPVGNFQQDSPLPRVGGSGYELMVQNPLQGTNSQLSMDEIGGSLDLEPHL